MKVHKVKGRKSSITTQCYVILVCCFNLYNVLYVYRQYTLYIRVIRNDFFGEVLSVKEDASATLQYLNRLTPNDPYMGRTAPLTSKRPILYIYSTNIRTEYFKHALFSPFFFSSKCSLFHNANLFGSCIIHILYTGCAKIKKIIPAPKG